MTFFTVLTVMMDVDRIGSTMLVDCCHAWTLLLNCMSCFWRILLIIFKQQEECFVMQVWKMSEGMIGAMQFHEK